jgi:hypothetical protein
MYAHRVSRKLYAIVLNRVVADTLFTGSLMWHYLFDAEKQGGTSLLRRLILEALYTLSVYAALVTYCILATLKLYMVARPLHVRSAIRLKRCVWALAVSWITPPVGILALTVTLAVISALRDDLHVKPALIVQRILTWTPLFAHLLLLVLYSTNGRVVICIVNPLSGPVRP